MRDDKLTAEEEAKLRAPMKRRDACLRADYTNAALFDLANGLPKMLDLTLDDTKSVSDMLDALERHVEELERFSARGRN